MIRVACVNIKEERTRQITGWCLRLDLNKPERFIDRITGNHRVMIFLPSANPVNGLNVSRSIGYSGIIEG